MCELRVDEVCAVLKLEVLSERAVVEWKVRSNGCTWKLTKGRQWWYLSTARIDAFATNDCWNAEQIGTGRCNIYYLQSLVRRRRSFDVAIHVRYTSLHAVTSPLRLDGMVHCVTCDRQAP